MAIRVRNIPTAIPELRAARTTIDQSVSGIKEAFVIARCETGRSDIWTHGRTWRIAPGTIALHRPGDVQRSISRDGRMTYQAVCVVPSAILGTTRMQSVLAVGDPRALPFHQLHNAVAARADRFTLECLLIEALGAMAAFPDVRDQHSRPVRRALELVRARLAEAITLDDLAAHAGLDKFHLCRAFRAQVGMPPHAYLTRLRVLRAKELLAAGVRPSEIAPQVGFYDQSQLNRHFRRIAGLTPGEYARAVHAPWLQVPSADTVVA